MSSSVGMIIPNNMESHKKPCSKPPTRYIYIYLYYIYIYTVMLVYQRVAGIGAPHGPSHKFFKARLGMKFRKKVKIPKTSLPVSYP